jgi:hypothetical protein
MRIQLSLVLLVAAVFACSVHPSPAQAQRVFVGATGSDSNPCTFASPCRSFQHAHDVAPAHGEIDVLDPAGYGAVTINKSISIQGHGFSGITVASGANGITINAGSSDAITLNGLILDGAQAGSNGIVFNSGGGLTVTNCVVQNFFFSSTFTGNGILIQPTSGTINFSITNTTVVSNANVGIFYPLSGGAPKVTGVIDHVVASGNSNGMAFSTKFASGGSTNVSISNSIASNGLEGIVANGATLVLSIDNVNISSNSSLGINADSAVQVLLGRSVIQGNFTGVHNGTSPNTFFSYRDNRIDENITNIDSPLNTAVFLQ